MSASVPRFHAIYVALNQWEFLEASLRSVYPHVEGITVITSHDRDRFDRPVVPDVTVERLLSRRLDPDHKIEVIVATEGGEPTLRNRAMAMVCGSGRRARPTPLPGGSPPRRVAAPDYFWIVDADEVYDSESVARLKQYVAEHPARMYLLRYYTYFKSWNWQIPEDGWCLALVRPGVEFGDLRMIHRGFRVKVAQQLVRRARVPESLAYRLFGARIVPREVATFHHGSYVGDRERIVEKIASSGHRDEFPSDWMERVWDRFGPDLEDFHPAYPGRYPSVRHVPTTALPIEIKAARWPAGWIER